MFEIFKRLYQAMLENQAAEWGYNAAAYLAAKGDAAAETAVARYWALIAGGVDVNAATDLFYQMLDALS